MKPELLHFSLATTNCNGQTENGIFSEKSSFTRGDKTITVDFGAMYIASEYSDPFQEIERRIALVQKAFN